MGNIETCAQCGQADDHPKVHIGDAFGGSGVVVTRHLDCLPFDDADGLRNDPNFGALNGAAIDAAVSGTHGDDLRALIVAQQPERDAIIAAAAPPAGPDDSTPVVPAGQGD